eukprot:602183-Pyramimonas_sp.AAC.1
MVKVRITGGAPLHLSVLRDTPVSPMFKCRKSHIIVTPPVPLGVQGVGAGAGDLPQRRCASVRGGLRRLHQGVLINIHTE